MLRVYFFGAFAIFDSEMRLVDLSSLGDKALTLLKFLILNRGKICKFEEIIDVVDPDGTYAKPQKSIRSRISEIRTALEADRGATEGRYIVSRGKGSYSFVSDNRKAICWVDIEKFEHEFKSGTQWKRAESWSKALDHFEKAVGLYRADFLTEDLHQEWAIQQRHIYREWAYQAYCSLAECQLAFWQFNRAIDSASKASKLAYFNQTPIYLQMKSYAYLNKPIEALDLYHRLCEALRAEGAKIQAELTELSSKLERGESIELPKRHTPNNIPGELDSFFGRELEIQEISDALTVEEGRLVTITGMGGIGKTRIVLKVASHLLDSFPDGVWFVELTSIKDPSLTAKHIAQTLNILEVPKEDIEETLMRELRTQKTLLILDCCEHLLHTNVLPKLISTLMKSCANLRIMTSSREILGIPGEMSYAVQPLALPSDQDDLQRIIDAPSVQLFIDRGQKSKDSKIELSKENIELICSICKRLDGIPLALELAAAYLKEMSLGSLLTLLNDRFDQLIKKKDSPLKRHETLTACIEWSYNLIDKQEKALFRGLGVFSGGFSLEAAEQVCEGHMLDKNEILDCLIQLASKSLVVADKRHESVRYRMLDTVQEFARQKLDDGGETCRLEESHASFFLKVAERAESKLSTGIDEGFWLRQIDNDVDNIRAAHKWFEAENRDMYLKFCVYLGPYWYAKTWLIEGRSKIELAVSWKDVTDQMMRGDALRWAGIYAMGHADLEASSQMLQEALEIFRQQKASEKVAATLKNLGNNAWHREDLSAARNLYEESLAILKDLNDERGLGGVINNLGVIAIAQEDFAKARELLSEALAMVRKLGDKRLTMTALENLGSFEATQGNLDSARLHLKECFELSHELGDRIMASLAMLSTTSIFCKEEYYHHAAKLIGAANRIWEDHKWEPESLERDQVEELCFSITQAIGDEAYCKSFDEGRSMSFDEAVEFALVSPSP